MIQLAGSVITFSKRTKPSKTRKMVGKRTSTGYSSFAVLRSTSMTEGK